jgi:hypothetical protein
MVTSLWMGLTVMGALWANPSDVSPSQALGPQPSGGIELSIGSRTSVSRPSAKANLARKLPRQLRFVADYLPPPPVPTPGLSAITDARQTRERAAAPADAARSCPEGVSTLSPVGLVGVGLAGAAVALHPTLVDSKHGTTIQINPLVWPPGINIQGVFF